MTRKIVIRSPLDRLPTHQKASLLAWLTTGGPDCHGITYAEAQKRLASEFGVKTGATSLHAFYQRSRRPKEPAVVQNFDPVAGTLTIVVNLNR